MEQEGFTVIGRVPESLIHLILITTRDCMAHKFFCDLNGDPNMKIALLSQKAGEKGIRFVGNTSSGQFSGWGLRGSYVVQGMQVVVTINSLPPFYTNQAAEAQIRGFLEG